MASKLSDTRWAHEPCPWEERVIELAFGVLAAAEIDTTRAHVHTCETCVHIMGDAKRVKWRDERRDKERDKQPEQAAKPKEHEVTLLALILAHSTRRLRRRHVHGAGAELSSALHPLPTDPQQLDVQMVGRPYFDAVGTLHLQLRSTDWSPTHRKLVHIKVGDSDVHVFGVPSSCASGDWEVLFRPQDIPTEPVVDLDVDPALFSLEVREP
ncbi:MAG: hypothetical protein JRH20_18270 [Deltaproteobacteria bacterium]|nr:hypothetical protein [Deltaproteobacteria bacterium]